MKAYTTETKGSKEISNRNRVRLLSFQSNRIHIQETRRKHTLENVIKTERLRTGIAELIELQDAEQKASGWIVRKCRYGSDGEANHGDVVIEGHFDLSNNPTLESARKDAEDYFEEICDIP